MSTVRQIGIKMVVDAQSVTTEVPKAAREFDALGVRAEQASARTTRSLAQVQLSVRDIVAGAAGLHLVDSAIRGIVNAITALPGNAFDFSKQLEVSQVGMAGILGSMTAINGQQTDYNTALRISSDMIRKLNDDALRTAATSQELTTVFQALLAPGLSAKMTLEEIRQLTVVGTNAVKSMGLESTQVVQELRDLVAGGITPASSTLATALGLKDSDIAKARASSEGLFAFLMQRLQGFEASSEAFGNTFAGKLEQMREGATRVAAEGLEPLIVASKQALGELAGLFVTIDEHKNVSLNKELVSGIREYASAAAQAMAVGKDWAVVLWDNRDAALALGAVWASVKLGGMVADTVAAVAAKTELAQASRLAAAQAAAEAVGNAEVVTTSRQKLAAYLAELEAKAAGAQAEIAAQAAQLATLATTREAIAISRAEVVAKLEAVRATMAQAEAQIAAARAAGAQSVALALLREGTEALTAAQARHALLMTELATLGKQQASVNAAVAAATAAQTAATNAATAAAGGLAAAQGAASIAGRALSGAVGFLGGPIGLVTTALTLGVTAWSLWGSAGSDAERKVQVQVARSTAEIVADLDKQIAKLGARNALAAAGMGELAKKGGEAAERLATLQVQINNLQSGKGVDGGVPLPEAARVGVLQALLVQYSTLAGTVQRAEEAQAKLDKGAANLTLTLTGSEQAWRKANDGVKTATAAQQEYERKLSASHQAWVAFESALKTSGASAETIAARQAEQNQVEKALADERDKKIKEMGASAATAQAHSIDAQIAATKQGYKLLAAQTADGLAEIDSLRKQDLLSEADTLERRTALQLQEMDAQRGALQAELELLKGKKDSAKEQANIVGELAELDQKRANLERQSTRDSREQEAQLLNALEQRIGAAQAAAAQAQENVRLARLDTLEIGQTGAALGALRQARVDDTAAQLEAQARTLDGIDLSGRAGDALRAQAQAVRDLAKTSGYNEAAKMVSDYAKAIDEGNAATQFEQGLSALSQRDRDIALEQYRIAVDLKTRIAEIDAKNPADAAAAAKLRADAEAAAARATAGVAARVNLTEWNKSVQQYDDIFRQGFADMLNRGEDGWKSFTKSLATTFKTTVADQLYKAFAQPFVVNIIGNLLGLTGLGGIAGGGGSGSGAIGAINTARNLNSLWGAASQALTGGTAGASLASLGYANAVGMAGGDAIGALATANGMWAGVATGAQAAAQSAIAANLALEAGTAAALPAGTAAAAAGTGAAASGSIMGALGAIPGWGWALAGVAALAGIFSKPKTYHTGGAASYSAEGGVTTGLGVLDQGLTFGVGASHYSADVEKSSAAIAKSIVGMLDSTATAFGHQAGYYAATAFADDSSKDGAWGSLIIRRLDDTVLNWADTQTSKWAPKEFADGAEGQAQYAAALAASVRDAVKTAVGDVGWAQDLLGALGDTPTLENLTTVVGTINAAASAFDKMGENLTGFAALSDAAVSALVKASGGIDALMSGAGTFYENFYSDAERTANIARDVAAQLADVGVKMPDINAANARDMYRAELERNLALGEDGAAAVAAIFRLSGAFAQITQSADKAAQAAAEAAAAERNALKGRLDDSYAALERSVAAERKQLDASRAIAQEMADAWSGVFEVARDGARDLLGEVASTAAGAAARGMVFIEDALASVHAGIAPDQEGLARALADARTAFTPDNYGTQFELDRERLIVAGQLSQIEKASGKQLTTAEQTVAALDRQIKQGQDTLDYWKQQIDIATGSYEALLSVEDAIKAIDGLLRPKHATDSPSEVSGGASWGGGSGAAAPSGAEAKYRRVTGVGTGVAYVPIIDKAEIDKLDKLAPVYHQFDGTGDLSGLLAAIQAAGGSMDDLEALSGLFYNDWVRAGASVGVPAFAGGGLHSGGLRLVGERGWEVEATGPARLWNQQQLGAALAQGGSDSALLRELQALRTQVGFLQQAIDVGNGHQKTTAAVLVDASEGGYLRTIAV